jgi:hypothetical protein
MSINAEVPAEAGYRSPDRQADSQARVARGVAETILGRPPIAESARAGLQDKRIAAVDELLNNRRKTQKIHGLDEITWQPPSPKKYPDWFKWDQAFADEMFFETAGYCWQQAGFYEAFLGQLSIEEREALLPLIGEFRHRAEYYFKTAREGLRTSFAGMDGTGFMPNSRILTNSGIMQAGLERVIIRKNGGSASVYTQPVLEPLVVLTGYEAAIAANPDSPEAKELLDEFYEPLALHLSYYDKFLADMPNSRLLGIPHPHASGRDSDRVFDHAKNRLPRKGADTGLITNLRNAKRDYQWALKRTKEIVDADGDMEKTRQKFWDRDVMFNCIYLDSLYQMAKLADYAGRPDDREYYLNLAEEVEAEIQTMWNPKAWKGNGTFTNMDKDYNEVPEVSVGGLFGLTLHSLTAEQLESMLNLIDKSHNTPYGFSVSPIDSADSDPHHKEKGRIWRDGDWDNVKWYIIERGLCMQAQREDLPLELRQRCAKLALEKAVSSNEALDRHWPPSEFRNPLSGEPQRKRVASFAWAMLPRFIQGPYKLTALLQETPEAQTKERSPLGAPST